MKIPSQGEHAAVPFSNRTGWSREPSALAISVEERLRLGLPLLDLTASNPTRCGFELDAESLLKALALPDVLMYDPLPWGRPEARAAVADYYEGHGAVVDPGQICLTASTSEAYSFLFRLLANPGDEILIASPSYPLFSYLATLEDVRLVEYPLVYEHGWHLAPQVLEERIGPRTRAIALVHPNNPTGHFVADSDRHRLERLCTEHGLALVVDEVFLDYGWNAGAKARSFAMGPHPALTFVLSGLSKIAGLPQMKAAWIGIFGPRAAAEEAKARLEIIADTFLSVSAPVQHALPGWLIGAGKMQQQIWQRIMTNLAVLDEAVRGTPVSRLSAEAGWYAVLRVPAITDDEILALRLLENEGVLVHPGSAFGFPGAGWIIVSLLPEPSKFAHAIHAVVFQIQHI